MRSFSSGLKIEQAMATLLMPRNSSKDSIDDMMNILTFHVSFTNYLQICRLSNRPVKNTIK